MARWQGLCAPAPGRRRWMSGSWWCRGRTAADCCWRVCAAWKCSEPRWGPAGPLQGGTETEDRRKGVSQLGTEKSSMSEPLRHLCWSFKTRCGGLERQIIHNIQVCRRESEQKGRILACFKWIHWPWRHWMMLKSALCSAFFQSNYNFCILKARVKKKTE